MTIQSTDASTSRGLAVRNMQIVYGGAIEAVRDVSLKCGLARSWRC
jgi:hypothetical protein